MKKFLTVLAVLALLATSAFAGMTTVTKEQSQANYPGVLTPGSLIGTSTFVSDLGLIANTATLELVSSNIFALVALKTDMGTISVSSSPAESFGLTDISVVSPTKVLGLSWANSGIGASVLFGTNSTANENKEVVTDPLPIDKTTTGNLYVGAKGSMALKGIDVALGVAFGSNDSYSKDLDNTSKSIDWESTTSNSQLNVNAAARMDLGSGLKAFAAAEYAMGSEKSTLVADILNDGTKEVNLITTETQSLYAVSAKLGKDIKATESLTVKMAAGVDFSGIAGSKTLVENKAADPNTKVYSPRTITAQINVAVPLNLAVEGKLNETWGVNAGTQFNIFSTNMTGNKPNEDTSLATDKYNKDSSTSSNLHVNPSISFAVGVTGKIGDLNMDLLLNTDIFENGPYFITGIDTADITSGVALSYNWK